MKKTLLINLKYIAFGLVLATLASYAHASWGTLGAPYTGPTGSFPNNNTAFPLNVGTGDQIKVGGLSLGGPFIAAANAQIDGSAIFHGAIRGGIPASAGSDQTVSFGGNGAGTHIALTGGLSNTNYRVQSTPLSNTNNGAICANEIGVLVLCDVNSTAPYVPPDPTSPPAPSPVQATAQVAMYIAPHQQGSMVYFVNTRTGANYSISMPGGQTTGTSAPITVPTGSYDISGWDVVCNDSNDPRYVNSSMGYLGEGDYFTITFNCQ